MNERKRLNVNEVSVIANNCVGGAILHDLKLQFNSPTVNLSFPADDYVRFCSNMEYYLTKELVFFTDNRKEYPCAMLGDVRIDFVHYADEEQALNAFERRKKRIIYDNIYFILCERENCTYDIMRRFDELPYKNKIIFTHSKINLKSAYCIHGFEDDDELGNIINYRKGSFKRYYDSFDYVSWFNNEDDDSKE